MRYIMIGSLIAASIIFSGCAEKSISYPTSITNKNMILNKINSLDEVYTSSN